MHAADRSILATLAYYDALRRPLTLVELYERLIPSARVGFPAPPPTLGDIVTYADALVLGGVIKTECGMYAPSSAYDGFGQVFIKRQKEAAQKYQQLLQSASWLQLVPFVRLLAASGSLAMGSTSASSDWDMFVIVKAGRLYTARLGLLVVAWLMGRLRTKRMRTAPDKFCFNHIITTDGLSIRHRSLFTAHALAWLVPMYDPWGYAGRLRQANAWVGDFVSTPAGEVFVRRSLAHSRTLNAIRRAKEFVLDTALGSVVERTLRWWMRKRIEDEPATHASGGRIVADNRELEFHPRSFEAVALARYNASLSQLGMGQYAEHDSGLMSHLHK